MVFPFTTLRQVSHERGASSAPGHEAVKERIKREEERLAREEERKERLEAEKRRLDLLQQVRQIIWVLEGKVGGLHMKDIY